MSLDQEIRVILEDMLDELSFSGQFQIPQTKKGRGRQILDAYVARLADLVDSTQDGREAFQVGSYVGAFRVGASAENSPAQDSHRRVVDPPRTPPLRWPGASNSPQS